MGKAVVGRLDGANVWEGGDVGVEDGITVGVIDGV